MPTQKWRREPVFWNEICYTHRMETKTCARCGQEKLVEGWPKQASPRRGLHPWCSECKNEYQRLRRLDAEKGEAMRQYDRQRRSDPARRAYNRAHDRLRHMHALGNGPLEMVTVEELLQRDGDRCCLCNEPLRDDITLEHHTPLSRGGTHTRDNLGLAHNACNCRKGKLTLQEWKDRWGR